MKIAISVDPETPVPPTLYGGIERIVELLVNGLKKRGHEVILFANKLSTVKVELVDWPSGRSRGLVNSVRNTVVLAKNSWNGADVVHSFSRLAYLTPLLASKLPKIMSYQREPTPSQIRMAKRLDLFDSLTFTGCSNYITNQIRPYGSAITVYNGVEVDKYTFSSRVDRDAPLMFLGRLQHIKGVHLAIEAAKKSGRRLIIAGNVPEEKIHKEYFKAMVKPHIDGRDVVYVGPVDDAQKNNLLSRSAALLMPITWNEPFGIVMTEAMACGTPVIGFARGAVPEVVMHGEDGFLATDIEGIVQGVSALNTIDRRTVRRNVETRFGADVIVSAYERLYQTVLGR